MSLSAMDPTVVVAAAVVGLVVAGTLLYIVLSAALQRQKWLTAFRIARGLLEGDSTRAMREAVGSDSPGERLGAVMALSDVDSRRATKLLCRTLGEDKDADVRSAAANALGQRTGDDVVSTVCEAAVGDRSAVVRGAAVEALGAIRSSATVPVLVEVLKEATVRPWRPGVRSRIALGKMATDALSKIGGPDALAALAAAQATGYRAVRMAAREAVALADLRQKVDGPDPDAPELRKLAGAYIVKRDFEEAIRWLEEAARLEPSDAETFETLGTLHQKLGEHEKAERCYRKAIRLAPEEPFPHFGLGIICQARGDARAARVAFERYLQVAPDGDQADSARRYLRELSGE